MRYRLKLDKLVIDADEVEVVAREVKVRKKTREEEAEVEAEEE